MWKLYICSMKVELNEMPGYYITDEGDLYNAIGMKMKPDVLCNGYLRIELRNTVKLRIHRLVAQYFIPNPEGKKQVNHIDGNKKNNHYANLQWVTNQENMIHAVSNGLTNYSKVIGHTTYKGIQPYRPVVQFTLDSVVVSRYNSVKQAKRDTGIQISGALSGRYKTAGGFVWKYA